MKKGIITIGVLTALTTTVNTDISFAENTEYLKSTRDSVLLTGKVNLNKSTSLNIRSKPSLNSSVKGKMKGGSTFTIIEKTNTKWYKVNYNGITGYISTSYITINSNSTTPQESSSKGQINTITSNVNLRKNTTISSSVLSKLKPKTIVDILEKKSNGWYYVSSNGKKGYVKSEYITLISTTASNQISSSTSTQNQTSASTPNSVNEVATVNAIALNIRSGNGTSNSIVTRAYKGNKVKILSESSNGWCKVELSSGITGWCNSKYLTNFTTGTLSTNTLSSTSSSSSSTTTKAQSVINIAKSKLGNKYVWGGSGPNNFDCSGLTQYAFKQGANVNIPRTSSAQSKYGTYVSKSNLKAGDLVFFAPNGKTVSHVGIYIGNNQIIHSPKPGDVVKIQRIDTAYYKKAYATARRIV